MKLKKVFRGFNSVLLSECEKYWIVRYAETYQRRKFFQVYKSVEYVPPGRMPWTRDNRRMGGDTGFKTLRDAVNFLSAV